MSSITPLTVLLSFILLRNKSVIFVYHHHYYNICYECKGHDNTHRISVMYYHGLRLHLLAVKSKGNWNYTGWWWWW